MWCGVLEKLQWDIMEEGGVALLDRNQTFEQTKLNAENMFANKHNIKNTFPVVIENPLSMIQAFPNSDKKQANMINEMTGYFSEYGNLTIFLDTSVINNENSCNLLNADSAVNDCYVVPDSTTMDSINKKIAYSENVQLMKKDAVAFQPTVPKPIEFINVPSIVSDIPEYIDIDALAFTPSFKRKPSLPRKIIAAHKIVPPDVKPSFKTEIVEIQSNKETLKTDSVIDDKSDDEVIFVKEYRVGPALKPKVTISTRPSQKTIVGQEIRMPPLKKLKVSPKKSKKSPFVPRRNPKRKAQLQKNYDVDFEFDFNIDNGDDENTSTEYADESSIRRPQRSLAQSILSSSTSSTSSSRSPIPSEYMREWPVDGMHERPHYNPLTGEIEKYDHVPKPKSKPLPQPTRTNKKGKRHIAQSAAKKKPLTARQKLLEAERINKEFAVLTHETFHDMIDYVKQFKRANVLMAKEKQDSDNTDKYNDKLRKVKDMLLDNSIFYCLANNVTQKDLAKYFVEGFTKTLVGS